MNIDTVQITIPSLCISNDDLLQHIKDINNQNDSAEFNLFLSKLNGMLVESGAKNRYWRTATEKPIDLIETTFKNALKDANCSKDDIDLLIYVGVGKGFSEPGNAYMLANCFDMKRTHCFDLLDACMSWSRAVHIAYQYLSLGIYQKVMIINGEFNLYEHGYPENFVFKDPNQLDYCFPSYTIGEATTVTILSHNKEEANPWNFRFTSRTDKAELCTIPNKNWEQYYNKPSEKIGKNGIDVFTSFGHEMHQVAAFEGIKILKDFNYLDYDFDIVIPHTSTKTPIELAANALGFGEKIFFIFQNTGNLVSASVPGGLCFAIQEGKLKRGQKVLVWLGSAGMSFGVYHFTY